MSLPDSGSAEILALVVVGGLGLMTRWVFKPARKHPAAVPVNAADARELGLLSVIATVDRQQAQARRAQLGEVGIRSSASKRDDGRMDILVFHGDVDQARRVLETS
jgi:hypothetical protein